MESWFMRERWVQCILSLGCAVTIAATVEAPPSPERTPTSAPTTQPTTAPVTVAPPAPVVPERHEPVPPPPPPAAVTTAPEPAPTAPSINKPAPPVVVVTATTQPGPIADPVAYAMGYAAGARIRARLSEAGRPADNLQILGGVIAGLGDHDPGFPREEMQAKFAEFQAYSLQLDAEKQYADDPAFRKRADDNLQKSRALIAQNAEMANVSVLPDGVQRTILKPGTGRVIDGARFLTVNLKVSLADGTLIKAAAPDKPERIAVGDLLPAVVDASRGMRVGGVWRLLLPPDKAYGLAGKPPVIGPNEAIEYELGLIGAD
jgi:FKBP-type peptidyl-prolyl cis-trans isomerase FklB